MQRSDWKDHPSLPYLLAVSIFLCSRAVVALGLLFSLQHMQIATDVWSVTSYNELRREGLDVEREDGFPSTDVDLLSIMDRLHFLTPVGFYYKAFLGKHTFPWFERLIRGFRSDADHLVKTISNGLATRRYEEVKDAAHALKGGAGSVTETASELI